MSWRITREVGRRMAQAAVLVVVGCSSSSSGPEDARPVLTNFVYEVLELNAEVCPTTGGAPQPTSVIRWSVDFSDADGDVEPPFLMLWQSQFYPRQLPPDQALITVSSDAVTAEDGSSGTISLRQCVKFVEQESIRLWIWILDLDGHWSDFAYLEIPRPAGAPAPPAESGRGPAGKGAPAP